MAVNTPSSAQRDGNLLDRFIKGDDRAAVELYERHGDILFSLAFHIVSDRSDAMDIVEGVFQQIRNHQFFLTIYTIDIVFLSSPKTLVACDCDLRFS